MREICVEYQWSFAKMLPLSRSSTTFHWRLADIWRMFRACNTYVSLKVTEKKFYARFIRSSLVIVRILCVVFRGAFVAHNHVFALFGAFACLCAEVRGLLVICAWSFRSSCAIHRWFFIAKWSNSRRTSTHNQIFMRDSCVYVLVGLCDRALSVCMYIACDYHIEQSYQINSNAYRYTME